MGGAPGRGRRRVLSRLFMQTRQKNTPTKTSRVVCSGAAAAAARVPGGYTRTNKFLHIKPRAWRSLMSRSKTGETGDALDLPQRRLPSLSEPKKRSEKSPCH
ncbi:hypothetical protein E2C01_094917 [Portunus trituberculatus]|uniref:Uncharacterized protein n=1 Tax=Portunus trituberculatus TaxID=210409 RepID=A0A5B7JRQ9_PORTR|nr:hypothetical protein [Portunus trituberculatus]